MSLRDDELTPRALLPFVTITSFKQAKLTGESQRPLLADALKNPLSNRSNSDSFFVDGTDEDLAMMGRQDAPQGALFFDFSLERVVPEGHLLRRIDAVLDLSGIREELQPFYSADGRPSIDPDLMIRMLLVGYCYGIRWEPRLCEERRMRRSIPAMALHGSTVSWSMECPAAHWSG